MSVYTRSVNFSSAIDELFIYSYNLVKTLYVRLSVLVNQVAAPIVIDAHRLEILHAHRPANKT